MMYAFVQYRHPETSCSSRPTAFECDVPQRLNYGAEMELSAEYLNQISPPCMRLVLLNGPTY